ncbi:hypothetical protein AAVH_06707 [Aphelenchoides avenae]|nr:hypothetical protein AAVH_06707 [Aphelenchus avenae]
MDDLDAATLKLRAINRLLMEVAPCLEAHLTDPEEANHELHTEIRILKRGLRLMSDTCEQNLQPVAKKARMDEAQSKALRPFHIVRQPTEILKDVFAPLDRWALDGIQLGCRRFRNVIKKSMSGVCLRQLDSVAFWVLQGMERNEADDHDDSKGQDAISQQGETDAVVTSTSPAATKRAKATPKSFYAVGLYYARRNAAALQCQVETGQQHEDVESVTKTNHFETRSEALGYFARIVRSARIERLRVDGAFCERTFVQLFTDLAPTMAIGSLELAKCVFGQYRKEFVDCLLRLQSLETFYESRRCLIDDHSLAAFAAKGLTVVNVPTEKSHGVPCELTDEGILAFLCQNAHPTQGNVALELPCASLSPSFCKSLIERVQALPNHQTITLKIRDVSLAGQDLGEYEENRRQLHNYHGYRNVVCYKPLGDQDRSIRMGFAQWCFAGDGRFQLRFKKSAKPDHE